MTADQALETCHAGIRDAKAVLNEMKSKVKIDNHTERIALTAVLAQLDAASSALFALHRELQAKINKHLDTPHRRIKIVEHVNGTGHAHHLRELLKAHAGKASLATLDALIDAVIDSTLRVE